MGRSQFQADDLIGTVIDGRFEVLSVLGQGGMGAVYAARQISMDRRVALKVLLHDQRGDPISAERFRREAYLAARLRHPNAIMVFDFGQAPDGLLYIAMEFLEGETLARRMRRAGPLPLDATVAVARQLLSAMAEAHRLGLIHRDLKPDNIFLTPVRQSDFVKVLDFGIAKLTAAHDDIGGFVGGLTVAGRIHGTPNYMSPEQIRGKPVDEQSDLYQIGVVIYEMLCGRLPFVGATPVDVMMMHLRDPPPSIIGDRGIDVPTSVEAVILRALEKDRRLRFESADAFLRALEGLPSVLPHTVQLSHLVSEPVRRDSGRRRVIASSPHQDTPSSSASRHDETWHDKTLESVGRESDYRQDEAPDSARLRNDTRRDDVSPVPDARRGTRGAVCPKCRRRAREGHLGSACTLCGAPVLVTPHALRTRDPLVGTIVDGCLAVVDIIGTGGSAHVYRALLAPLRQEVALKVVLNDSQGPRFRDRFMQEAQILAALNSPAIARLVRFGKDPTTGLMYMAQELAAGPTLASIIRHDAPLPPERVVHLALEILGGLAEAHAKDVVHRDLKPQNIVVQRDALGAERIKLLDFGIARLLAVNQSRLTQTGAVIGTPNYMAPEMTRGPEATGASVDIYALGVTMYAMLSGRTPFSARNPFDVLLAHASKPVPRLPSDLGTPAELEAIVRRALAKQPEDRYPSAAAMALALGTYAGLTPSAPPGATQIEWMPQAAPSGSKPRFEWTMLRSAPPSQDWEKRAVPQGVSEPQTLFGRIGERMRSLFGRGEVATEGDVSSSDDDDPGNPRSPGLTLLEEFLTEAGARPTLSGNVLLTEGETLSWLPTRVRLVAVSVEDEGLPHGTLSTHQFHERFAAMDHISSGDGQSAVWVLTLLDRRPAEGVYRAWHDLWLSERIKILPVSADALRRALAAETAVEHLRQAVLRHQQDPFVLREPVLDPLDLFGTEGVVQSVLDRVLGDRGPVGVMGLDRSGVTSILERVRIELPDRPVALVDLAEPPRLTVGVVGRWLSRQLAREYSRLFTQDASWRHVDFEDNAKAEVVLSTLRANFDTSGRRVRPVLLLDECEFLLDDARCPPPARAALLQFIYQLGCTRDAARRCPLVLGGNIAELLSRESTLVEGVRQRNPLWDRVDRVVCPLFDRVVFDDFMTLLGARAGLEFEPDALAALHRYTGGHPYVSRLFGSILASRFPGGLVTVDRVTRAARMVVLHNDTYFTRVIRSLPPKSRSALRRIAETGEDPGQGVVPLLRHRLVEPADDSYRLTIQLFELAFRNLDIDTGSDVHAGTSADTGIESGAVRPRPRGRAPVVFVCYHHEGDMPERVAGWVRVLELEDFDVRFDRYAREPGGWANWSAREIRAADHVIVVCSPGLAAAWSSPGIDPSDRTRQVGQGVHWEAGLIQQILLERLPKPRITPVIFDGATDQDIPLGLRSRCSYFRIPVQQPNLLDHLRR